MPKDVDKVVIDKKKDEWHVMIHNFAGLISLVQISALEIHTWNCKADDIEHPDQIIFDLDPGPGVPWKSVLKGVMLLRDMLQNLKLTPFLKTSGGKGLHVTIPIVPNISWDQAKSYCKTIAEHLAQQSKVFVTNMRKDLRGGKIYLDYLRNGRGATAVAPYGTRARASAAVSMPITWEECAKLKSAGQHTILNARKYLEKRKRDPWNGFEQSRVDVNRLAVAENSATP